MKTENGYQVWEPGDDLTSASPVQAGDEYWHSLTGSWHVYTKGFFGWSLKGTKCQNGFRRPLPSPEFPTF